jgi:hypothetical protein
MLKGIFEFGDRGGLWKLHKAGENSIKSFMIYNTSPNIIRTIQSRRMW